MDSIFLGELTDVYNGVLTPKRIWQGELQTQVFSKPLLVHFEGTDNIALTPTLEQSLNSFLERQKENKQLALGALLEYYQSQILLIWREIIILAYQSLLQMFKIFSSLKGY